MTTLPLFERVIEHGDRIAVQDKTHQTTYAELLRRSELVAAHLLAGHNDLNEARVGFLIPAGPEYVAVQWGIWRAGGIAVPLSLSAVEKELEYTLTDAEISRVVVAPDLTSRVRELCLRYNLPLTHVDHIPAASSVSLPEVDPSRRAMMLFTSGTTGQPKGVVSTHTCIQAQIESLVKAWHWQSEDCIPLFLPLHHIHGIINVMSCALWSGGRIDTFPVFDSELILKGVSADTWSVFMAVPTIYVKLIAAIEALHETERQPVIDGFGRMRLMISGSAALPASVHSQWTTLTGQKLLERYGMTEIGMALSNPYSGERRPGAVGQPLPGVSIRLWSEHQTVVAAENTPGEIHVKGPCVFHEYWNRPDATESAFLEGWFQTGDIAILQDGYYRIMGRSSVDIIKSGGYKLSALEIEAALLDHPAISECAVVGIPDGTWGETVSAAVVLCPGGSLKLHELRSWCKDKISSYKIPHHMKTIESLPRNAMGKVTKPAVTKLFTQ